MSGFTAYKTIYGNTGRCAYWDTLKGFLIVLVVVGHFFYEYTDNSAVNLLVSCIYVFHMPAFVFVTGYLSGTSAAARSREAFAELAAAYLLFNFVMPLVTVVPHDFLRPHYSFWYLLAVMVWRFVAPRLCKIRRVVLWCVFAALLAGFFKGIDNTFALARIIAFSPFFMAGYMLKREQALFLTEKKSVPVRISGLFAFFICAAVMVIAVPALEINLNHLQMTAYFDDLGFVIRTAVFALAALAILGMLLFTGKKPVPFISAWGRNSLSIFLLHRYLSLIFAEYYNPTEYSGFAFYAVVLFFSIVSLFVTGSNLVSGFVKRLTQAGGALILGKPLKSDKERMPRFIYKFAALAAALVIIIEGVLPALTSDGQSILAPVGTSAVLDDFAVYNTLSAAQKQDFDNAFRLLFAGDLILLEDAVKNAYDGDKHDFSSAFEYTEKYIKEADLAIAVFEGPLAGEKAGYTTSNFEDGFHLALNFPDSFAYAVKDAGFDIVTTANNHILDKGLDGAMRTIDIIEQAGLINIGSYRSFDERENVTIAEKDGIRFAFLAYTYGAELYPIEHIYAVSYLAPKESERFEPVKQSVLEDFERAKRENPDIIIVLPHMGEQFIHAPDDYQQTWYEIFSKAGADIIFCDHGHAVQPVYFWDSTLIISGVGNYTNSYTDYNGDASALAEVYIDRDTKKPFGVGVIPLYANGPLGQTYRALPVYEIMTNKDLAKQIGVYEFARVKQVHEIVTQVMLGFKLGVDMAQPRFYLTKEGFFQHPVLPVELTDDMKTSEILRLIENAGLVCFAGDSVTAGSRNGGTPWHKPMMALYPDKPHVEFAWDGGTTLNLTRNAPQIAASGADLYITAIGANDIRYRDASSCAMDAQEYVLRLSEFTKAVLADNKNARFCFIAPWLSLDNDPFNYTGSIEGKDELYKLYGSALREFCEQNGYLFIDPNPYIKDVLKHRPLSDYLLDHIHPGRLNGIRLYSEAVIKKSVGE